MVRLLRAVAAGRKIRIKMNGGPCEALFWGTVHAAICGCSVDPWDLPMTRITSALDHGVKAL